MMETWFRIVSGLVVVSWVLLWLHGARAGLTKKSFWQNSLEPWWVFWPVRALVLASAVATFLYLFFPEAIDRLQHQLPVIFRIAGLLLAVAGLVLFRAVFLALASQFSTSLVLQEGHKLVSHGPYRFIRHPMYWAYILMWLSLWLLTAHAFVGATGVVAIVYVMICRTPQEEAMLSEAFGEQWQVYCGRTGRFFPKVFSSSQ